MAHSSCCGRSSKSRGKAFWLLSFLIVLCKNDPTLADFGLPYQIIGGNLISSSAIGVNNALNSLTQNLRRNNWNGQSERFRASSEIIVQIAQRLHDLGKQVTGNVTKAANDKSTPVGDLFGKLMESFDGMSQYLKTDIADPLETLTSTLGNSLASDLKQTLSGFNQAVTGASNATENIQQAVEKTFEAASGKPLTKGLINDYISLELTSTMSRALMDMRDQTVYFAKLIEGTLKNIAYIDTYLVRINSTSLSTEQRLNGSQQTVYSLISSERDNVLKRYFASQFDVRSEISAVVTKLAAFNSNRLLQPVVEKFSEAYTKIYYYLYQRNKTETSILADSIIQISTNVTQQIQNIHSNFTQKIQQVATKLGIVSLSYGEAADTCYRKHEGQALKVFDSYNGAIQSCLVRERNKLSRVVDGVDRILRLAEANAYDFAANIGFCLSYSNFDNSPLVLQQAQACLYTNLNQMPAFQDIIAQSLDAMRQACMLESDGIKFRVSNCLSTRANETQAIIDNLNADVEQCVRELQQVQNNRIFGVNETNSSSSSSNDGLDQIVEVPVTTTTATTPTRKFNRFPIQLLIQNIKKIGE